MKFCPNCGKENSDEAVFCMQCGTIFSRANEPVIQDKPSVGLCILAVFIPLFGLIYWPVEHNRTPNKARACGIAAIVSIAFSLLFL